MKQIVSTGLLNSKIEDKADSFTVTDFNMKDIDGKSISTHDFRGKVVFINFWASWCPPCRAEFPSIQKMYEKYKDNQNVEFLTINLDDDVNAGKKFLEKNKYSIPFWVSNGNIPQEIYNGSLPTTVILDKNGKIRLKHTGMADYSKNSFYQQLEELIKE
ncbi:MULTISPECIES: TlpA disulfide reductase family protein [unclassified Chryseobacterium]|uniref:TlpA family protein disulfide reductase n=1 Tax=unclassified Chryseobacterium TaxID=2593645 RepID=UPI002269DCD5|nr:MULTISPECIES: TlpA disulfide reductase family protein [unclassified Chryseobacterium]